MPADLRLIVPSEIVFLWTKANVLYSQSSELKERYLEIVTLEILFKYIC